MSTRALTPAEKYYAFLDPVSPMNLLIVAHLDRCLPVDLVAEHWSRFVRRRVTTRLQVHGDLTMSDGGSSLIDFAGWELPSEQWDAQLARESERPFGLDRPMGCRYLTSPDEGRSRLYLTVHHALADARGGVADLQALLRFLDGQAVPEQTAVPVPGPPRAGFPWQTDRQELIALLRRIKSRNDALGTLSPAQWPRTEIGQVHPRVRSLVFDSADLVAAVKRNGTKMFAAIAAGWLGSVAQVVCDDVEPTLQLSTPVDLAVRGAAGDQRAAAEVGIVSGRYRVDPSSPWPLAHEIQAGIAAATDNGEGELFFHLARTDSIDDLQTGSELVRRALSTTQPSVSVTNLGIVDPGTDPEWVRGMCGYLAPSPNHVVFVSGAGYRGRLVQSITTSDRQLTPGIAARVVDTYQELTERLSVARV